MITNATLDRAITAITTMPALPDIALHLDETGDFPELIVTARRKLTRAEIAACHAFAGEQGATIEFRS